MTILIGLIVTLACMLGGFVAMGGKIDVIWQPWEYVIILGASLGTFIVANPMKTIKDCGVALKEAHDQRGAEEGRLSHHHGVPLQPDARDEVKSRAEVEKHIDNPTESPIFTAYPKVLDAPEVADVHLRLFPSHHHGQCPHA